MTKELKLKDYFIGDRNFYSRVIKILIPIIIQNTVTNVVSLLDNVMVGGLGTESISAVAIVNQIIMVFNLTIFGGLSGASIFGAQFAGKSDWKGQRHAFRFKMYFGVIVSLLGIGIFLLFGDSFINMFLQGENDGGNIALTLQEGHEYLRIMLWGLLPFVVVQTYVGTLRETGETVAPMIASVTAILVNLVLNWVLIFGHLGLPAMGVKGAAIATVISRYVEIAYIVIHSHAKKHKYHFLAGAYSSPYVPRDLIRKVSITGLPLLANEVLWSLGITFINQSYSSRGLSAVAAINITATAWNLFCVIMFAMGSAVAILVGQRLGAGDKEGARDVDRKLLFMSTAVHVVMGLMLIACSELIPMLYNIEPAVRELTAQLLRVAGLALPIHAYSHVVYFTIRSGGKTGITFLFDCVYTWVVPVTMAYCLCHYTQLPILWVYFAVQFVDVVKVVIGALMLRSDFWANNVVDNVEG